jgi:ATP-dependent Clp protease adapter protein ClpS
MPVLQVAPVLKVRAPLTTPKLRHASPPYYKLFLHKDIEFEHRYVSKVVSKVIEDMTIEEANDKATQAYLMGISLLRVCPQDIAVDYCERIRSQNVKTTIEPIEYVKK